MARESYQEKFDDPHSPTADHIIEALIIDESTSLRRFNLIYQVIGRVLFTEIILALTFWRPESGAQVPITTFVILLALLWLIGSVVSARRARFISKLIAEKIYSSNPRLGSLFIEAYHLRYADPAGRVLAYFSVIEPILWGSVCLWLLLSPWLGR
jgi:hypothetical protein